MAIRDVLLEDELPFKTYIDMGGGWGWGGGRLKSEDFLGDVIYE